MLDFLSCPVCDTKNDIKSETCKECGSVFGKAEAEKAKPKKKV